LASDRIAILQYASAAPVSLKDYVAATKLQAARVFVDRRTLRMAFSDLVVPDRLLDQLGPALISQNSIFLYGPSGNGKSTTVEQVCAQIKRAKLSNDQPDCSAPLAF
jgi:Cdc6-like AAA superfamily ATPase